MWNELTFLWSELTILWNDLTTDWNDLTWNDLTMERNDRIPFNMQNVIYTIRVTNNDFQPNRVAKILLQRNVQTLECHVV